jgi:hypothetical protein
MAFTVTISKSTAGLESAYSASNVYIAGAKHAISEVVPSGTTNQLVNFNFNASSGKVLAMGVDTDYDITLKTNNSATPINVFKLNTASPMIFEAITGSNGLIDSWSNVDSNGEALETITSLYVSNTGTSPCTLLVDSLFDPTP